MNLHNVRRGIGATRALDYSPAVAKEISAIEGVPEQTEADDIAVQAAAHDQLGELRDPTCIKECGRWGDQEIGKMIREYRAGVAVADIAADLGEKRQAVAYELKCIYHDFQARKGGAATRGKRLTKEQVESVLAMHKQGRTYRDISRELRIAESTVRYVVDESEEA